MVHLPLTGTIVDLLYEKDKRKNIPHTPLIKINIEIVKALFGPWKTAKLLMASIFLVN
jgi:hypothetical protein